MILEKQKESITFQTEEDTESIKMSLDLDSAQMLMQMLSKNLYSDEIGSTVRELCSNALDSHRRAGVKKPIVVSMKMNQQYNYEFCVEDFGVGLDDIDVRDIISKYGKSLAREEAGALGMMGLGFKAPLAYTSAFYFIGRKNGVERKWMMYEGEDGNTIDPLYEQPTEEPNGVKVLIPIKSGDSYDFVNKMKEQLAYFEDVFFECDKLSNDYIITRSEDFQYSTLATEDSLHISLDNVYYPLDFTKLGIDRINVPVALRFGLRDGIFPTPNREALRYTADAKKIILAKLVKVADYFITEYNKQTVGVADVRVVFEYYKSKDRNVAFETKVFNVAALAKHSSIAILPPTLKGVKYLDLKLVYDLEDHLVDEYNKNYHSSNRQTLHETNEIVRLKDIDHIHYYVFTDKIAGNKREYVKSLLTSHGIYYFVKKVRPLKLKSRMLDPSYFKLLKLDKEPKHLWRKIIQEYQFIQSQFTSKFIDYDAIEIPKTWLDNRKKKKYVSGKISKGRAPKLQGEAVGKIACDLERCVSGSNCKFIPQTISLQKAHQYPGITVYVGHDHAKKMDPLYAISNKTVDMLRFITFSDREMKNLAKVEVHNLITYEKFMEGNNKPFKRLITGYLINVLIAEQFQVFTKRENLHSISKDLYDKLCELSAYKQHHYVNSDNEIYAAMLEVAKSGNLFDMDIYDTYLEVKGILEKFPFINQLLLVSSSNRYSVNVLSNANVISILCDMLKYHKFRIDYQNYRLPAVKPEISLTEDVQEADELEEEEEITEEIEEIEEIFY